MNISERASWLANDFREGLGLELSDLGVFSMAAILRVQFLQVAKAAQHRMYLTAFGAFLAGGFVGGLLMLIVLVGLYGGR